jgi:hypothetical protein
MKPYVSNGGTGKTVSLPVAAWRNANGDIVITHGCAYKGGGTRRRIKPEHTGAYKFFDQLIKDYVEKPQRARR